MREYIHSVEVYQGGARTETESSGTVSVQQSFWASVGDGTLRDLGLFETAKSQQSMECRRVVEFTPRFPSLGDTSEVSAC